MAILSYKNVLIMDYADVKLQNNNNLGNISNHTFNTWQINRSAQEKMEDTKIGKFAEDAVGTAFAHLNIRSYISYDDFRTDNFKLHAPFDGLFIKNSNKELFKLINNKVIEEGSSLSAETKELIRNNKALTCEIKSTRLSEKYKSRSNFFSYSNKDSLDRLLDYLFTLDYLNYPHFTRYGDMTYFQYCQFARTKNNLKISDEELNTYIRDIELSFASDIFIRVFVDESLKKIIIMGWIDRHNFLTPPETHKLILPGKSELPLYFVKSLKKGFPLELIIEYLKQRL